MNNGLSVIGLGLMGSALAPIAAVGEDAGLDGRLIACMRTDAAEAITTGHTLIGNAVLFKRFRNT